MTDGLSVLSAPEGKVGKWNTGKHCTVEVEGGVFSYSYGNFTLKGIKSQD